MSNEIAKLLEQEHKKDFEAMKQILESYNWSVNNDTVNEFIEIADDFFNKRRSMQI